MTQGDLTRRQHYVPDFYLQGWTADDGAVTVHDLENLADKKTFRTAPRNALVQKYFYEEDPEQPDNRIENILSAMEGRASSVIEKVRTITSDDNVKSAAATLSRSLDGADLDTLLEFAAYQYLRVPGAMEKKRYELEVSTLDEATKSHHLNPGRFTESGYAYIANNFRAMKVIFLMSPGSQDFLTSDWPCFDVDGENEGTLLGEDIGRKSDVVAYMPITPRVGMVMHPNTFTEEARKVSRWRVTRQPESLVRSQNALIVQQAERFVVARHESPFIFAIAAKRRKGRS